ncbi:MAG: hypothetical protein JNM98_06180 [Rhodocyclaceae bacterium]|nr:hypothetical protein [Rhodocyclaceae bacterium]
MNVTVEAPAGAAAGRDQITVHAHVYIEQFSGPITLQIGTGESAAVMLRLELLHPSRAADSHPG